VRAFNNNDHALALKVLCPKLSGSLTPSRPLTSTVPWTAVSISSVAVSGSTATERVRWHGDLQDHQAEWALVKGAKGWQVCSLGRAVDIHPAASPTA
jgi:hypothetical protein